MKAYQTKPKLVEHAIQWSGYNTAEIEEILCGYSHYAKQYGDQLKIGTGPCSFKMLELGEWIVVLDDEIKLYSNVNFGHEFEQVEI